MSPASHTGGRVPGFPITFPLRESDLVIAGSRLVPIATNPPGPNDSLETPLCKLLTLVVIGSSPFFVVLPGRISILSPTLILPILTLPPKTPPLRFFGRVPGLFMSNDLATFISKSLFKSLFGVGKSNSMACINKSIFRL